MDLCYNKFVSTHPRFQGNLTNLHSFKYSGLANSKVSVSGCQLAS